jgi:choline dehydrogenase-like flavoprotein
MSTAQDTQRDRTPSSDADVCIVGSGPAGSLTAARLSAAGHDVVVLEAGKRFDFSDRIRQMEHELRPAHSPLSIWDMDSEENAYRTVGDTAYAVNLNRVKGVGGSTLHWNGTVSRLLPKDFEMNSRWGLASDWPVDYDDLRPHYADAETELGVSGTEDNPHGPPREEPYPMEGFPRSYMDQIFESACESVGVETNTMSCARNSEQYDGRSSCVGFGTCRPVCPSGAKYSADSHAQAAEETGARIIDRATVQRFDHGPSGETVTAAVYQTPDGETHRQEATEFVLAAGGIENPRLLLQSDSAEHPDGLANSSGVVGKYLMDHVYVGIMGELDVPTEQHQIGFNTMESWEYYEPEEAPPGSFKLAFQNRAGPTVTDLALAQRTPVRALREVATDRNVAALRDLERSHDPIEWGDDLLGSIDDEYGNYFRVVASLELLPHEENQVRLSDAETDAFGNPVPAVDWGHRGEYVERTQERAFEVMEEIVDALDPSVSWTERTEWYGGVAHPSGTTRMGTDPDESVVDANLRTHDVENLYVCGSSTFVTVGANQPTLTIAALALRLADHLDRNVL